MTRRDFLRKTIYTFAGLCFGQYLFQDTNAFASPVPPEASIVIVETNLKFGPLEKRQDTKLLILHHIGGTDRDVSAAEVHQWHLANGWSGIGYHYVIRKNGSIERGRPRIDVGAHTLGFNETSIGINIVGDFEVAVPKDEQIESAAKLLAALCNLYNLSPNDAIVLGHKDLNSTLCPGKNLYAQLDLIRNKVHTYMKSNYFSAS